MVIKVDGLDSSSLTELIDFREDIDRVIRERFERQLALLHTDVVGSTQGFQDHGDVTGRGLQQRHLAIVTRVLENFGGTLFNTAGDGAWCFFESAEDAVRGAILSQRLVAADNRESGSNVRLNIRAGVHIGPTLQDGTELAGHSVNLCARIADLADSGQVSLSRETFSELGSELRGHCGEFAAKTVKGVKEPVEFTFVEWRNAKDPVRVLIEEMGRDFELDRNQAVICIGRQRPREGRPGNDIVVRLEDAKATNQLSRFQVELRWTDDGLELKSVSEQSVVVDGRELARNDVVPVSVGSRAILSGVLTCTFLSETVSDSTVGESVTVFVDRKS